MQNKILIISPINQWGGVNMDVGFIAQFYKKEGHQVYVLSSGDYYGNSSILEFIDHAEFNSLDRILFHKFYILRVILKLLNLLKPLNKPLHHRVKNKITSPLFPLNKMKLTELTTKIKNNDVIFICNQFSGKWVQEIVTIATKYNKKVIFRVSGQIQESTISKKHIDTLRGIHTIILHSDKNKKKVEKYFDPQQIVVIDQCVFLEQLYKRKYFEKSVTSFYTLSRFDKLKNIATIIESFKQIQKQNITLSIYGDGNERSYLERLAEKDDRIKIFEAVSVREIHQVHNNHQCLIIASTIEAGPYTGIEAMAAGNLIISTKVGAMEERLGINYPYFYDGSNLELKEKITTIFSLEEQSINKLSNELQNIYKVRYSYKKIKNKYLDVLRSV